jgi:hypothetical protein
LKSVEPHGGTQTKGPLLPRHSIWPCSLKLLINIIFSLIIKQHQPARFINCTAKQAMPRTCRFAMMQSGANRSRCRVRAADPRARAQRTGFVPRVSAPSLPVVRYHGSPRAETPSAPPSTPTPGNGKVISLTQSLSNSVNSSSFKKKRKKKNR